MKTKSLRLILVAVALLKPVTLFAAGAPALRNEPVDVSGDFREFANNIFTADKLGAFDPATARCTVQYRRHAWQTAQAFDNMLAVLEPTVGNEFPGIEYAANPELPFTLEFVSSRTVRLRMASGANFKSFDSLMLAGPVAKDASWKYEKVADGHRYTSAFGSVTVTEKPWRVEFRDAQGRLLTRSYRDGDEGSFTPRLPFSFVRRAADYSRSMAAVFTLSPGKKI